MYGSVQNGGTPLRNHIGFQLHPTQHKCDRMVVHMQEGKRFLSQYQKHSVKQFVDLGHIEHIQPKVESTGSHLFPLRITEENFKVVSVTLKDVVNKVTLSDQHDQREKEHVIVVNDNVGLEVERFLAGVHPHAQAEDRRKKDHTRTQWNDVVRSPDLITSIIKVGWIEQMIRNHLERRRNSRHDATGAWKKKKKKKKNTPEKSKKHPKETWGFTIG
mmetsp:Transcript_3590/g.8647  ORF Transcript_3590/g.8647 Transcript_3590/m.8647 type:complete len:216 (+) Transcript_3590:477-1124(+)